MTTIYMSTYKVSQLSIKKWSESFLLPYFIFPKILGNCQKNNSVQQIAAVASDIASAAYTPVTPI